jgi:poly-gamma-glutamate synthesis protein (capsule biosynthesis protein)
MKYFIALAVSIIFTGDILLDRGVRRQIETSGVESLFAPDVDSLFRQADVVVGNLECPVTRVKAPVQKLYCFRGEPQWLDALKAHGFTHLNMANNHTVDQGRRGLRDTWQNVRRAGMVPVINHPVHMHGPLSMT